MVRKNAALTIFLVIGLFARFVNLRDALYFTYDQGRDLYAVGRIAHGDFTLIGPTTGLEGFFTGPLWYYAGVPGYVLGNGNPYVASAWYIFLASLALPLYWWISHRLFAENKKVATVTAYFLALQPGSITASLQIWNPLLLLPIVAVAFWLLMDARVSRGKMVGAFFLLGLGLHAEFASALFLLVPLYVVIFWLRGAFDWRDYGWAGVAVAVTLLPQLIFDLRNDWLLTRSLLQGVFASSASSVDWLSHLAHRSEQLFGATSSILVGPSFIGRAVTTVLLAIGVYGLWSIFKKSKKSESDFRWQLIGFLAVAPYPLYLFWRGNNGYFWDHYLTSQFLFLVPVIMKGAAVLARRWRWLKVPLIALAVVVAMQSCRYLMERSIFPTNTAGLTVMNAAVSAVFEQSSPGTESPTVLIYTPNVYTDHYRYLFDWHARQRGIAQPQYLRGSTNRWYVLLEPDYQIPERMQPWYYEATKGGMLMTKNTFGHLQLETWEMRAETDFGHYE